MRLASFTRSGKASYGIVTDKGIVDLGSRLGQRYPDMRALLGSGMAEAAQHAGAAADFALADVQLLPPVPNPEKILCVGLNYATHVAETGREKPAYPMLFTRYAQTFVGHGAAMIRPKASEQFDFEGELAFVIGKGGRHIAKEQAMAHVAGYAPLNDGTLRDWQRHTIQFIPGKNFARSGAWGPWLTTPDEAGEIGRLTLTTRLNGAVMQQARLDDLIFDVAALIAYISTFLELAPGDVVATGTTGGVGAFRKPPLWMKAGDTVEVEIERLGTLSNRIADES